MVRSKLEQRLDKVLKELFPAEAIVEDMPIKVRGRTLYVDRVLKNVQLAIEVDGRQHSEFIERFHKDAQGFKNSQERDALKEQWLVANGYTFVRFKSTEQLTAKTLRSRILKALK